MRKKYRQKMSRESERGTGKEGGKGENDKQETEEEGKKGLK